METGNEIDPILVNKIRAWLRDPKKDYFEGLELLKAVNANPNMVRDMKRIGDTEPGSMFYSQNKSKMIYILSAFLYPQRFPKKKEKFDNKPKIHISASPVITAPDEELLRRTRDWISRGEDYNVGLQLFVSLSKNNKLLAKLTAKQNRKQLARILEHTLKKYSTIDSKKIELQKFFK